MLAASVAFIPSLAFAAGSPQPAAVTPHGLSNSSTALAQAKSSAFKTFTSPASHSVRGAKSAAATASASDSSPTLALTGTPENLYSIQLMGVTTGLTTPITATINWGDGKTSTATSGSLGVSATHTYAALGTYNVSVTVTDAANDTVTNTVPVTTAGSDYTAYGPTRLLDTRKGLGAPKAEVQPHAKVDLKIAGNGQIPAGVTAVVLNVTVTNPTTAGYVTVYPDLTTRPTSSNVNFVAKQTVPNQVIAQVGADGNIVLYNGSDGTVDLVADVAGYFTRTASSGYTPLTPYRLADTRYGTGTTKGKVGANGSFSVQIAGNDKGKLPSSGITAVALNVTVTNPKSAGYVTVYPDGKSAPTASNLNFTTNETVANSVIVPVGGDGKVRVLNSNNAGTDVIVDVVGYYSATSKSAYLPAPPSRLLDTRTKEDGPAVPGNLYYPLVLPPGTTAWVLNATVTDTKSVGHLSVAPDPNSLAAYENGTAAFPPVPSASTLNWTTGKTVPNMLQASTGSNNIIDFWNLGPGSTDLVIDALGIYANN